MDTAPTHSLHILTESEFSAQIGTITQGLLACRHEGFFRGAKDCRLHYEYFLAENSRASVVIVHGLSEFIPKYYETVRYLLDRQYNVFLYEQRCHGLSDRLTDRTDLLHVDRFDDYAYDLDVFIRQVVAPVDGRPLLLYAHSMGGAVVTLYLAGYRHNVRKALLTSPLMDPQVGNVPHWVAHASVIYNRLRFGPKTKFHRTKDFDPDFPFEKSSDGSYARFSHNLQLRRENPCYQTSPMSVGWVDSSLYMRTRLPRLGKKISIPILLLSAEQDTVVVNDAQHRFAAKCPSCRLVTVPGSKHAMLTGAYETIQWVMDTMLAFFGEE